MATKNTNAAEVEELEYTRKKMEERTCCCGSPRGPQGIVEKVYRARNTGFLKCKVIMESGGVRYLDTLDVYVY